MPYYFNDVFIWGARSEKSALLWDAQSDDSFGNHSESSKRKHTVPSILRDGVDRSGTETTCKRILIVFVFFSICLVFSCLYSPIRSSATFRFLKVLFEREYSSTIISRPFYRFNSLVISLLVLPCFPRAAHSCILSCTFQH